jgi:hypothetical protein
MTLSHPHLQYPINRVTEIELFGDTEFCYPAAHLNASLSRQILAKVCTCRETHMTGIQYRDKGKRVRRSLNQIVEHS